MTDLEAVRSSLPGYEVGGELGRGGMGIVLSGRHLQLDRSVAIKELPPVLARDASVRARFVAEARVLAALDHPHIVPIYDFVEHDGVCLLVMESLPGGTVWSQFASDGFTPERACATTMITCAALHYAHVHRVLHRDIKPENLLFSATGQLKVADFGIAKVVGGGETLATSAGDILGTPAYMAPEQAEGRELGPPADIFATGVMLYELLSGKLPYSEDGGALAIVYRHVYEDPIPLRDVAPHVPPAVAHVVMRALARRPEDRYATAEAMGVALGEAATSAWGDRWLGRSGVSIMSSGPITAAAERPTIPDAATTESSTATDDGRSTLHGAGPPPLTAPPPAGTAAPPTVAPGPSASAAAPVRPSVALHVAGARPVDLEGQELVPVRTVLEPPPPPTALAVAALVLLVLTIAAGFVGVGGSDPDAGVPAGAIRVAGSDIADGRPVPVDFGADIEVAVAGPAATAGATQARLAFSVAGVPLVDSSTEPLALDAEDGAVAVLDVSGNRYLAAGELDAELELLDADGEVVAAHELTVEPESSRFLTVPAGLGVALLLVVLAYAESALRPMRRSGKRRAAGFVSLAVVGAGFGVAAALAGWVLSSIPLEVTTMAVSALLGAVAGVVVAMAALRVGRRRRLARAVARQQQRLESVGARR